MTQAEEMTARIIDGKATAAQVREEVRQWAERLTAAGHQPGLAVILVGDDPASQVYVRNKDRAAEGAGFFAQTIRLPATTTQAELLASVQAVNDDDRIHGILVQLPLPDGLDERAVLQCGDLLSEHIVDVNLYMLILPDPQRNVCRRIEWIGVYGKTTALIRRCNCWHCFKCIASSQEITQPLSIISNIPYRRDKEAKNKRFIIISTRP